MDTASERKIAQRERLIEAAERAIDSGGLPAVKARELAREVGVALGAIYNLVADMDEIYLRVASRTLARLDGALAGASPEFCADRSAACGKLVAIALAYRRFASENLFLWRALFELHMADDKALPDWALADQLNLFRHILEPLHLLTPEADEADRQRWARTLFGAVHGIVFLGLEKRPVAVPLEQLDSQIDAFVRTICSGLPRGG